MQDPRHMPPPEGRDPVDASDAGRPVARPSEPAFNIPSVILVLLALMAAIHLLREFVLTRDQDVALLLRAAYIPARYGLEGGIDLFAFTSPVTYSLLHGSWAHLAVNSVWLAAFGSPLAVRLGIARFLAFWVVTAIASVALHHAFHSGEMIPVIGASGAISGMMGAAARFGFAMSADGRGRAFTGRLLTFREVFAARAVLTFLGVWFAVNLVTGLGFAGGPSIAWEAHVGGFLAGFLLIGLIDPFSGRAHGRAKNF